jgi:hypothetical protein
MSLLDTETERKDVEFNTGFVTALALYYGHRQMFRDSRTKDILKENDLRNYGASDHLFDIEYPMNLDEDLKKQIEQFVGHALNLRLGRITEADTENLFEECLSCLKEIDKKVFHVLAEVKYP